MSVLTTIYILYIVHFETSIALVYVCNVSAWSGNLSVIFTCIMISRY